MELFSELYSAYYLAIAAVLRAAGERPLCTKEITEILNAFAFEESAYAILPKLTGGEWGLLKKTDKGFISAVKYVPPLPLTSLQARWLSALTYDPRIRLFFTQEELEEVKKALEGAEPLYMEKDFIYFDQYRDGDDYADEGYQRRFRELLKVLDKRELLFIKLKDRKGDGRQGQFLPLRLTYSARDDKFRLSAIRYKDGQPCGEVLINLGRVESLSRTGQEPEGRRGAGKFISAEPAVLEIRKQRNAVERAMLHFANYEKRTEYDESTGRYICSIYYDKREETDLLIRVLSFGPMIRVLGPEKFLCQVKRRIKAQYHWFHDEIEEKET